MLFFNQYEISGRIKQRRIERCITQREISELLGYSSERYYQRIERGDVGCSVDKLMEIAQILNVTTDYLLFGDRSENIIVLNGCTKGQQEFLQKMINVLFESLYLLSEENETIE